MPVKVTKSKKGCYRVSTPNQVHAKCTTKKKALAQKRLLNAVEHGWKPTKHHSASDGEFLESRKSRFGVS